MPISAKLRGHSNIEPVHTTFVKVSWITSPAEVCVHVCVMYELLYICGGSDSWSDRGRSEQGTDHFSL